MDFSVRKNPEQLESTGFVEIAPGRYSGRHWQPGCIFVWEDAFTVAEGIISAHFPDYDHLAMNDIPKVVGVKIAQDLRTAATRLMHTPTEDASSVLKLNGLQSDYLKEVLLSRRSEMSDLLLQVADTLDSHYEKEEWACVLGV